MNKIFFITFILFLGCKNNAKQVNTDTISSQNSLEGTWELESISNSEYLFDSLFKNKIPTITFDTTSKRFNGNSSCNFFNGKLKTDGNQIDFNMPIIMTKMFCEGEGENIFMEILKKIDTYTIDNEYLIFSSDDKELMKFIQKNK